MLAAQRLAAAEAAVKRIRRQKEAMVRDDLFLLPALMLLLLLLLRRQCSFSSRASRAGAARQEARKQAGHGAEVLCRTSDSTKRATRIVKQVARTQEREREREGEKTNEVTIWPLEMGSCTQWLHLLPSSGKGGDGRRERERSESIEWRREERREWNQSLNRKERPDGKRSIGDGGIDGSSRGIGISNCDTLSAQPLTEWRSIPYADNKDQCPLPGMTMSARIRGRGHEQQRRGHRMGIRRETAI